MSSKNYIVIKMVGDVAWYWCGGFATGDVTRGAPVTLEVAQRVVRNYGGQIINIAAQAQEVQ